MQTDAKGGLYAGSRCDTIAGMGTREKTTMTDECAETEDLSSELEGLHALGIGPSDIPDADDVLMDPQWVRSTGKTPLEFLSAVYRHPLIRMNERIAAAKTVMEYAHRKMPSAMEVTGMNGGPLRVSGAMLSGLSDEELGSLEMLLEKAARSAKL